MSYWTRFAHHSWKSNSNHPNHWHWKWRVTREDEQFRNAACDEFDTTHRDFCDFKSFDHRPRFMVVLDFDCAVVEACQKPAWKSTSTWTFSVLCYKNLTFNNRADSLLQMRRSSMALKTASQRYCRQDQWHSAIGRWRKSCKNVTWWYTRK